MSKSKTVKKQFITQNYHKNIIFSAPIFPHRSAYSQHHPSRPTYLPSQLEAYPAYLSAAAAAVATYGTSSYSSSSLTQSSADTLSQNIPHKATNERSHSMSSLSNGHHHHHHHHHHPYQMKEKEPKSAGPRLIGNDETRCVGSNNGSSSSNNNNNNNFKVPSGKEGSLKHRILTTTRPHENNNNKHGTINHPANR
jgi:hypothetical protein